MSSLDKQKENFLHKTVNITAWMKESILKFVEEKEYTVFFFDISTEIMTRLGKITVINTLSLKMKNKQGEVCTLGNYNSMSKEYEDVEMKWLVDFIKEKEMEAILKFGGIALGTTESKNMEQLNDVSVVIEGEKKFETLKFEVYFNSKVQEMIAFLTEPRFVSMWTAGKMEEDSVEFENTVIRGIKLEQGKVFMEYKWKDWKEFSPIQINFEQVGDNAKLCVVQRHIPAGLISNVKNHWDSRIFGMISTIFGCALKNS